MKTYTEKLQSQLNNPKVKNITLHGTITDTVLVNHSVHFKGKVVLKAPLIIEAGLEVIFENVTAVVDDWAGQIAVLDDFTGHLVIKHSDIVFGKNVIKNYITHANTGTDMVPMLVSNAVSANIEIDSSTISNVAISANELQIQNATIGQLFGPRSTFFGQSVMVSSSTISNYDLTGQVVLRNVMTEGFLHLYNLTDTAIVKDLIIIPVKSVDKNGRLDKLTMAMQHIYRLLNQVAANELIFGNVLQIDGDAQIDRIIKRTGVNQLVNSYQYGLALFNISQGMVSVQNVQPGMPLEYQSMTGGDLKLLDTLDEDLVVVDNGKVSQVATNAQSNGGVQSKALASLNEMIGLTSVKDKVKKMIASAAMRKKRNQEMPSLHMVFSGNAGTGKTTVADVVAEALFENGVIRSSKVVKATKQDLVAGYMGQTATKTRKVIESAYGGVLFIDEAYTLTPDERSSGFEADAIAELIAQMENHRDDLLVILAGYTNEMRKFMHSNQGLNSRFKTWIEFPDYTADDLTRIAIKQLRSVKVPLDKNNVNQLAQAMRYFEAHEMNDGNGRFARNFTDAIVENRDTRLFEGDANESLTKNDILGSMKQMIARSKLG